MEDSAEGGIPLNQETIENIRAAAKLLGTDISELDR
jgi:hypothetical protein